MTCMTSPETESTAPIIKEEINDGILILLMTVKMEPSRLLKGLLKIIFKTFIGDIIEFPKESRKKKIKKVSRINIKMLNKNLNFFSFTIFYLFEFYT